MEIVKLHYFLTTCACGSYSAAAKQLFTTRQAVSKAIHQLESELNTVLFIRQSNELVLTADGEYLKKKADAIFKDLDDVKKHFSRKQTSRDCLRVAFSLDVAVLLPTFDFEGIQKFNIRLTEHSIKRCIADLEKGLVDLCILSCMQKDFPPYLCQTICCDPLIFIVSDRLYKSFDCNGKTMNISDLVDLDILLLSDKEYVYADFLEKYRKLNLGDERLHTVSDQELMRKLVRSGTAIGLAPSMYTQNLPDDLVGLRCSNRHLSWYVTAVYEKSMADDPRIAGFIDYLRS